MAARRLQNLHEWTNQNLFLASFDSGSYSYQNTLPTNNRQPGIQEEDDGEFELQNLSKKTFNKKQNASDDELADYGEIGHSNGNKSITALQTAWNVTNAIQGMFIVGLPFAVKVGGWCAIAALIGVAWICYKTGLALIECLYEEETNGNGRKRIYRSYREVAEAVRPGMGKFVLAAQLVYSIYRSGRRFASRMFSKYRQAWMMLTTLPLLGTAFLDDLRVVSNLSLANAVSHLVINAIMFSSWRFSSLVLIPDFRLFPTIIGVVVFGYTSHIFLPSLEGSMQDRSEFKQMLGFSHVAAAIFKALFGLIGFLTFAEFTQKEISNSLPDQTFKVLVNLCLVTKALLSYPLPYYAIVQLIGENFFNGIDVSPFPVCYGNDKRLREWALSLRVLLILWTLWMALTVPYLIEVIAGGIGTCIIGMFYSAIELIHSIRMGDDEGGGWND
uniref:Aa_trans domain-containing protein n=1 Tax=Meloidogyne hapla TaxID=6305 RepID=A0A1I8B722_MELHA